MNLQTAEKTASLTESASAALSMGNHTESQFEIETLFCPVSWINWKPQTVFVVLGERFCFIKSFENSGILCVLRDFQNALPEQKIRPKPKRAVFRGALL